MMQFTIKNVQQVLTAIREYPDRFFPPVQRGMEKGMHYFVGNVQREQMSGRPGLKAPTGTLRRANRVIVRGWGKSFQVSAQFGYPNAPYVLMHQRGGLFTSRGKMFTIPLRPEAERTRPKDHANLTLIAKNGHVLLGNRSTSYPYKFTPLWLLKRTINIPKRLHIPEAFTAQGPQMLMNAVAVELGKAFRR